MQIVVVTGMSGAGKSTALRALEDIECYVVDNLPVSMIGALIEQVANEGSWDKVAIGVDARQQRHLGGWGQLLERLRGTGHRVEVLFLDARDDVLLRRFSETRRRHPLSGDDLPEGIRQDRVVMAELRDGANVIDTSSLTPHQLKSLIQDHYGGDGTLAVTLVSFGFKHGLPAEFNLVFDVRFLPNPHFEPGLRPLDGRDDDVAGYVFRWPESRELLEHVERLLRFALPQFQREGKLYVTIAIGCTGGRHRSVALVEELRRRLSDSWDILVRHRDVDRDVERGT
jgi:UPF0042 nucleotide-binding protein